MGHSKLSKVFVNGYHLSREFDSYDIQINGSLSEKSGFQDEAKTYNEGQITANLNLDGFFDDAANKADELLSEAVGNGESIWCIFPEGDDITKPGYGIKGSNTSHNVMSTKDDNARIAAACQSNYSAERVISLLALSTKLTTGSGTVNNNGVLTASGGSAYIQATAITGNVAVKIEHSTDNSTWVDLVSFTNITAIGAQRVEIAGTIRQYTKVTYTLDGGESITMQVSLHRN